MIELEHCPVCQRDVHACNMTYHHYVPRCQGGKLKDTIRLCKTCHETLHYCIEIEEACLYDTVDRMEDHPVYRIYIDWIRTKKSKSMYKVKNIKAKYLPELRKLKGS